MSNYNTDNSMEICIKRAMSVKIDTPDAIVRKLYTICGHTYVK